MPPYERRRGVTPTEQREAQRGARARATPATRRGGTTATTGIERIATRARQAPQTRYTALRGGIGAILSDLEGGGINRKLLVYDR